jgi:hypothetical protein
VRGRVAGRRGDRRAGGYWISVSNGPVLNFHAPWSGALTGKLPAHTAVASIAGV